jgi:hypothetical protein
MATTHKSRGRSATLPRANDRANVRCVVTRAELAEVQELMARAGLSQQELARRALMFVVRSARKKVPEFLHAAIDREL